MDQESSSVTYFLLITKLMVTFQGEFGLTLNLCLTGNELIRDTPYLKPQSPSASPVPIVKESMGLDWVERCLVGPIQLATLQSFPTYWQRVGLFSAA